MSSNHWRPGTRAREANFQKPSAQSILACGFLSKRGRAAARDTSDASATLAESDAGARCVCWLAPMISPKTLGFANIIVTVLRVWTRKGCPSARLSAIFSPCPEYRRLGASQQPYHGLLPPSVPRAARGGAVAGGARRRAKQHELAVLRLSIGRHVQRVLRSWLQFVLLRRLSLWLRRRTFEVVWRRPMFIMHWVLRYQRKLRHSRPGPSHVPFCGRREALRRGRGYLRRVLILLPEERQWRRNVRSNSLVRRNRVHPP